MFEKFTEKAINVVDACFAEIEEIIKAFSCDLEITDKAVEKFGELQQLFIDLGNYIEAIKGENYDLIKDIENICEIIYLCSCNEKKSDDLVKAFYLLKDKFDKEDVMGVTWKVNPGAFIYRKSLAMEYLGYDDEDNVQSFVKDWDTLIDTARTISKKSNGAVKLLSSADVLDKQFEPGIANTYTAEANDINVSSQGTVFGYFCDLDVISKLEKVNKGTSNGDWAICHGPEGFVNGGSWMFVTDKCPDKELAGEVIKKLCTDSNVMAKMAENDREFVNNKKVMSNAYNTNKGKLELLGGGDYIKVFDKVATKAILEKPEDIVVEQEIEAETEGEAEQE